VTPFKRKWDEEEKKAKVKAEELEIKIGGLHIKKEGEEKDIKMKDTEIKDDIKKEEGERVKIEEGSVKKNKGVDKKDDVEMKGESIKEDAYVKIKKQQEDVQMEDLDDTNIKSGKQVDDKDNNDEMASIIPQTGIPFLPVADFLYEWETDCIEGFWRNRVVTNGSDAWDRFVTDSERSSGRVYDRLYHIEIARLIPYGVDGSGRPVVFDILTGVLRARTMIDDMRWSNEGRTLEISQDEYSIVYEMVEG
jgi:hypothetical protein